MPVSPLAAVTVVAKNYLSFARVLAASFHREHPDVPFYVLLADEPDGYFEPAEEPFAMLELGRLGVPSARDMLFGYEQLPATVAAKAYALEALLERGHETALFLDADVLVLAPLNELFATARRRSITLTPHLLETPAGKDRIERELVILRSGAFNGGLLAVSDREPGRRFLAWWQRRVQTHCRHAVGEAMHYDQKWLDLVPAYFDDFGLLRDPGVNVAHWNLHERPIRISGSRVTAAGRPCRVFHFSGYDPFEPQLVTRYSRELRLDEIGDAALLFASYRALLEEAGWAETRLWPYSYETFDNGVPIPPFVRQLYGELEDRARFGDPFDFDGHFMTWLAESSNGGDPLPRLWELVRDRRPDLLAAFPDHRGADRAAFLGWTREYGVAEYGLPPELAALVA